MKSGKWMVLAAGICLVLLICAAGIWLSKNVMQSEDIVIKTPYCDLHYPEKWKKQLKTQVQEDPYMVTFSYRVKKDQQTPLFAVAFDAQCDLPLGSVTDEQGNTVTVGVIYYDVSQQEELSAMQADLQYLIDRLPLTGMEESTQQDFVVQTPYADLVYPGKWKPYVKTEILEKDGYTVSFMACFESGSPLALFDITFAGTAGDAVGAIETDAGETVRVSIQSYELGVDALQDPEAEWRYIDMREDLNYILQHLELKEMAPEEMVQQAREAFTVETPYGSLSCQSAWGADLFAEVAQGQVCTVTFFGKVTETEAVPLFSLAYGGDSGRFLGELEEAALPVYLQYYGLPEDGSLPQETMNKLYAMQEEVNRVIQSVKEIPGFRPAV